MSTDPDPPPSDEPKTFFSPIAPRRSDALTTFGETVGEPQASQAPSSGPVNPGAIPPPGNVSGIAIGEVLNHIYEVRRFIARGGMGEVYEGVNINNPAERVAIKVILPSLAADPTVQAMFRNEATMLTRLSHPALVQYRLLAQEPRLGILYIVTEYIDGQNLSDVLTKVPRDCESLVALTRRLAEGLLAAHRLGAVHRDMSPDNVILEHGELELARIIDFGIAKDLDPSKATIIGDGFAGKLGFVAPEQLGDFGREVGKWSDVYSLALVIVAVARGKHVDMGATPVDAIDRRRAGVDVSDMPEPLRGVLAAMLRPDPKERLRSMDEVLAALAAPAAPIPPGPGPKPKSDPAPKPPLPKSLPFRLGRKPVVAAAGVAALLVVGLLAVWLMGGDTQQSPSSQQVSAEAQTPEDVARSALTTTLPAINCSWLDIDGLSVLDRAVTVSFKGVAADTAGAQARIGRALADAGLRVASLSFENVSPAPSPTCALLDAYRPFKAPQGGNVTSDQAKYEKEYQTDGDLQGEVAAAPQIHISADAMRGTLALGGIDPDGLAEVWMPDAERLKERLANPSNGAINSDGSATLKALQQADGLVGVLLVRGNAPINATLVAPPQQARDAAWRERLLAAARQGGWTSEIAWFRIVNEVPDAPPPSAGSGAAQPPAPVNAASGQ